MSDDVALYLSIGCIVARMALSGEPSELGHFRASPVVTVLFIIAVIALWPIFLLGLAHVLRRR